MSNRLAIDPSEIKISDPAAVRARLWFRTPGAPAEEAPVVKAVDVDFGFDTPIEPQKAAALTAFEHRRAREEAIRKQEKAELIRQNEQRIDAWIEEYRDRINLIASPRAILNQVAGKYGVLAADIIGLSRLKKFTNPRQEALYEIRARFPRMSLFQIGHLFSDRDHSTVKYGIESHAKRNNLPIPYSVFSEIYHSKKHRSRPAVRS